MPQAISPDGFPDCRAFLDKAAQADKGYRQLFTERGAAWNFRMRAYTARLRERQRNAKAYPLGHPMYNATVWDTLVMKLVEVNREGIMFWAVEAQHSELGTIGEEEIT